MEGSSQPENPKKYTKRELFDKFAKGLKDINPQILKDPNYQVSNPNVPEHVKQQRLTEKEEQEQLRTRRGALATIGAAVASIGLKLGWTALSERFKKEQQYRDEFWSKNSPLTQTGNKIIPPGTLPSKSQK